MGKLKDLTGLKFGTFTPFERVKKKKTGKGNKIRVYYYWKCKCECGEIKDIDSSNLLKLQGKWCGCVGNSRARIGQKYGRLTLEERLPNRVSKGRSRPLWKVRCDCGTYKEVLTETLFSGKTLSCGCLQREVTRERTRLRVYENLYNHLKKGARERGHSVHLSYEEFVEFTKTKHCHYCTKRLVWSEYLGPRIYSGHNIDRMDNSIGYTKGNCVVCCGRCNRSKSNLWSYKEWRLMTKCFREKKCQK